MRCYRRRRRRRRWSRAGPGNTVDFRGEKNDEREGRKGRKKRARCAIQCFCYICQLTGRSWESLCDGQTWPTMRKLKIDEPRLFFFGTPRTCYILFPEIIRPVISCRRRRNCVAYDVADRWKFPLVKTWRRKSFGNVLEFKF